MSDETVLLGLERKGLALVLQSFCSLEHASWGQKSSLRSPSDLILGELRLAIGQINLCIPDLSSSITGKKRPWLAQLGRTMLKMVRMTSVANGYGVIESQ